MTTFGARVKKRRLELGMSQRELARKCGVSHPVIGFTESGRTTPTLVHAVQIAEGLEINLSELLDKPGKKRKLKK